MSSIIFFYISCFWISFLLGIPIGPVNLEIFHTALKKHYAQAISIAVGAALGDAVWAVCAFFGISPFSSSRTLESIFLLFTAVITFILGIVALKNSKFLAHQQEIVFKKIMRKRWALLKGLSLVLVNPLGVISWMIGLQFLKKNKIFIPMEFRYEVIFFIVVTLGAACYFLLVVLITSKMKNIFSPERTCKITKVLGYVLLTFSVYFLYIAIRTYFFNGNSFVPV